MISNGLKPNNTKGSKVKLDENKIAEIIVATVQPMIDKAFQKVQPMLDRALEPIKKDISDLKWYTYQLVSEAKNMDGILKIKNKIFKNKW